MDVTFQFLYPSYAVFHLLFPPRCPSQQRRDPKHATIHQSRGQRAQATTPLRLWPCASPPPHTFHLSPPAGPAHNVTNPAQTCLRSVDLTIHKIAASPFLVAAPFMFLQAWRTRCFLALSPVSAYARFRWPRPRRRRRRQHSRSGRRTRFDVMLDAASRQSQLTGSIKTPLPAAWFVASCCSSDCEGNKKQGGRADGRRTPRQTDWPRKPVIGATAGPSPQRSRR